MIYQRTPQFSRLQNTSDIKLHAAPAHTGTCTHTSLQLFPDSVVSPNGMWLKSISTCTLGQALGYRHAHNFCCCRQVHGYLSWNIPLAKTKRASSEYLKIALDWQPNCHHYSFHHSYQPCGAHAIGGQSRCFHGAFHASPSTQPSSYPLISSLFPNPALRFLSMICSSRPSMALLLLLVYFFPPLICPPLWKHWWVRSNTV